MVRENFSQFEKIFQKGGIINKNEYQKVFGKFYRYEST